LKKKLKMPLNISLFQQSKNSIYENQKDFDLILETYKHHGYKKVARSIQCIST